MNLRKILLIVLLVLIILVGVFIAVQAVNKNGDGTDKIKVVASNFSSYDFLRAIIGDNDNVELTFLLGPGKDAHSYDPTAQDLVKIQNSDLFVYIGGELESWADKVMSSLDTSKTKVICISDDVARTGEKAVDGAEEHEHGEEGHDEGSTNEVIANHGNEATTNEMSESHKDENTTGEESDIEFDEHIWTSPGNAILMVNTLEKAMAEIDNANSGKYKVNADAYIAKIKEVDNQIKAVVNNKVRDRLVFGDKMPMQYFIDYYNLQVSAAFSGCSTESEPSSKTIAYLVSKVKEENIPVVFYIEMSEGKVAKTIAEEAGNGAKALQIQTIHNVSKTDFDSGATWVSLMKNNVEVLKQALQ